MTITVTATITITITITKKESMSSPGPNAHTYVQIDGKRAAASAGKTEWEICSPQDSIVYLSCRIKG